MLECRAAVPGAIRRTSDAMDEEGDSNAEPLALFTQLKSPLEIDARMTRQATIDNLNRRASGNPIGGSGDAMWDRQWCEFLIAQCNVPDVEAGGERETAAELARRSGRSFEGIPIPVRALSHTGAVRDAWVGRAEGQIPCLVARCRAQERGRTIVAISI
jgi:hypothetical protein